jgi:hypothetical protein
LKELRISLGILLLLVIALIINSCGGGGGSQPSATLITPYLQAVTAGSIYILAESQTTDPLTVNYGPTDTYGNSAVTESVLTTTNSTYIHRIKLTGLAAESTYFYRLGSHAASFKTAVNSGTNFRFAWMADCRTGVTIHDQIAQRIQAASPSFSLYGGDLCDDGASYSIYREQFFRPNQLALAAGVPFFNTTGNHEKWAANTKAFTQAPASVSGNQGYYSFDYGDLHVVVMNYMDPGGYAVGSIQYDFIRDDLAATTKKWKIVICHSPAYVSGGHGEDPNMIALTTSVFEPRGVDLVLAGHDHFYQRNLVNGLHHLIIGSAGASLTNLPASLPAYVQLTLKSYCYGIFDLSPTSLQIKVYNETGAEIDSLLISKP